MFGPGPQLVWGPNAAGKTSLLEAIVAARVGPSPPHDHGRRARPLGRGVARVEGRAGAHDRRPRSRHARGRARADGVRRRPQADPRQRRRPPGGGAGRRAPGRAVRARGDAARRRARRRSAATALDQLAGQRSPGLRAASSRPTAARSSSATGCCGRSARSRRPATSCGSGTRTFLEAGGGGPRGARRGCSTRLAAPLAAAHARDRAGGGGRRARSASTYVTNAPALAGETPRDALARRLAETAEKEVWNGTTLDRAASRRPRVRDGRPRPRRRSRRAASSGRRSSRSSSPSSTSLTALDGRPPLLLLDDVFRELDPARRAHLVRRIADLPQAFVTTTTLEDLDPALRAIATPWAVTGGRGGAPLDRAAAADAGGRAIAHDRRRRTRRRRRARPSGSATCIPRGRPPARPRGRAAARARDRRRGDAIVAERVPAGRRRVPAASRIDGETLVVEADAPIVAPGAPAARPELLAAFARGTGRRCRRASSGSASGGAEPATAAPDGRRATSARV